MNIKPVNTTPLLVELKDNDKLFDLDIEISESQEDVELRTSAGCLSHGCTTRCFTQDCQV